MKYEVVWVLYGAALAKLPIKKYKMVWVLCGTALAQLTMIKKYKMVWFYMVQFLHNYP